MSTTTSTKSPSQLTWFHASRFSAIAYAQLAGFEVLEANEAIATRDDMPGVSFTLTAYKRTTTQNSTQNSTAWTYYWKREGGMVVL